jgi:hypothetical protein
MDISERVTVLDPEQFVEMKDGTVLRASDAVNYLKRPRPATVYHPPGSEAWKIDIRATLFTSLDRRDAVVLQAHNFAEDYDTEKRRVFYELRPERPIPMIDDKLRPVAHYLSVETPSAYIKHNVELAVLDVFNSKMAWDCMMEDNDRPQAWTTGNDSLVSACVYAEKKTGPAGTFTQMDLVAINLYVNVDTLHRIAGKVRSHNFMSTHS